MTHEPTTVDLPIAGMDCAECTLHVDRALRALPGVRDVRVLLSAERATVTYDPGRVDRARMDAAVARAGYRVLAAPTPADEPPTAPRARVGALVSGGALGALTLVVLVAAIAEQLGILDRALEALPWWIPAIVILVGGFPILRGVFRATLRREVTSHTLMTVGALAAVAIGQWTTAAMIVFFMRFAGWMEDMTVRRGRAAIQALIAQQPARARVIVNGREIERPVAEVTVGDWVVVRPGERIPVDGRIREGYAPVDEASITGESIPAERGPGDAVHAATIVQAGFLKIEATRVGADTTMARIIRLVEEAESQKAPVQRFADRFASAYLPVVLLIALATLAVTGQVLNAVAVLVVACSCAIVLATPVVVLASVGAAARHGFLIKGGRVLESLARIDTLVMDKTGTLTLGRPRLTEIVPRGGADPGDLLRSVASLEGRSEHPVARAIVAAAVERGISLVEPDAFTPIAGRGIVGSVEGATWAIGNRAFLAERGVAFDQESAVRADSLERRGHSVFFAAREGELAGLLAVADVVRPEVRAALKDLRTMGIRRLLLLTGDGERVAAAVAAELGLAYRAGLLPEEKIAAVRELQAGGAIVMMVGDGINDAPALAQADVGVAMGARGTDVAIEAADVALMRDDWMLVPEAIRVGRRASRTIRQNLGFAALYNIVGIGLAAMGLLPPVWAAAAQSLPDVAIMVNSALLLRGDRRSSSAATLQ